MTFGLSDHTTHTKNDATPKKLLVAMTAPMAYLAELPNELKLSIIEHLGLLAPRKSSEYRSPRAAALLPEVNECLLGLSTVNKNFRALVAPLIFHTVLLRNTARSGASVNAVAGGELALHVKKIEYLATTRRMRSEHLEPQPSKKELEYRDENEDQSGGKSEYKGKRSTPFPRGWSRPVFFPDAVEEALENLNRFPNLEGVAVQFASYDMDYGLDWVVGFEADKVESVEELKRIESDLVWRSLMNASYTALARNPPGTVKALQLRNLLPAASSCWYTDAWRAFLERLQSIEIGLREGDGTREFYEGTMGLTVGYSTFLERLNSTFFRHLSTTTHLALTLTEDWAYALYQFGNTWWPLENAVFPHLQSVTFHFGLVGPGLTNFLHTHAATLRSVSLTKFFAPLRADEPFESRVETDYSWAQFFASLGAAVPPFPLLSDFRVTCEVPKEELDTLYRSEAVTKWINEGGAGLLYGRLDFENGSLLSDLLLDPYMYQADWEDWERQRNRDRRAYEEFIGLVEGNRAKLRFSKGG